MPLRVDESPAGYNIEAETPQNQKGTSPGVHLHQPLEERVECEGGQADAGERQSQHQGAPASEVSHDCSYHGSKDQPPAQTWRRGEGRPTVRGQLTRFQLTR